MKHLYTIFVVLALSGCVTGSYQPFSSGYGYQSEPKGENTYYVTYTGSGNTGIEKINDFALLRSAELTLEKGFKYFVITEAKNNKEELQIIQPSLSSFNDMGGGGGVSPGTLSGPKAKSELTILLFNEKPDDIHYEAERIVQAMRDEYQIGGQT